TLVFGSFRQGAVCVLRTSDGQSALDFAGHSNDVDAVRFSPDGKTLATGGNGAILLWDVGSARRRCSLTTTSGEGFLDTRCLAFGPDGHSLATPRYDVGFGSSVEFFNPSTGKSERRCRVFFPTPTGLA